MKKEIFYFSGTGNSLAIAKQLGTLLHNASIIPIASLMKKKRIHTDAEMIGIVFPVLFLDIPRIVKIFLQKLTMPDNPYVFAIANGNGLVGKALLTIDIILIKKGCKLNFGYFIDMPGNCIIWYDFTQKVQEQQKRLYKSKIIIKHIAVSIHREIYTPYPVSNLSRFSYFKSSYEKFSMLYLLKNHIFYTTRSCNGCGNCVKVCPVVNIFLKKGKVYWHNKCEFCLACLHWCPNRAIQSIGTQNRKRYHNLEITYKEICNQLGLK